MSGWPEETFADEIARAQDGDTILFRVSIPLAVSAEWSAPVRLRFQKRHDGTYALMLTEAEDEIERLRTALERVYQTGRGPHVEIARAALNA